MTKCETCKEDIIVDMGNDYHASSCGHIALLLRVSDGRLKTYLKREQKEDLDWKEFCGHLRAYPHVFFVDDALESAGRK